MAALAASERHGQRHPQTRQRRSTPRDTAGRPPVPDGSQATSKPNAAAGEEQFQTADVDGEQLLPAEPQGVGEVQAIELGMRAKAIEFTATGSQIYHQADLDDTPVARPPT